MDLEKLKEKGNLYGEVYKSWSWAEKLAIVVIPALITGAMGLFGYVLVKVLEMIKTAA